MDSIQRSFLKRSVNINPFVSLILAAGVASPALAVLLTWPVNDNKFLFLLIGPLVEEFLKFLPVVLVAKESGLLGKGIYLKESSYRKAAMYVLVAAATFAFTENVIYLLSHVSVLDRLSSVMVHILATSIVAMGWYKKKPAIGLLLGTIVHIGFNLAASNSQAAYMTPGTIQYAAFVLVIAVITLFSARRIMRWQSKGELTQA
jgi:RsiW-degrading membrane proteinase PrsW (M82 family)